MDCENSDLIIDNKTWEKADFKESTLLEAVRGLPDYIKAILPDQILNKVKYVDFKYNIYFFNVNKIINDFFL